MAAALLLLSPAGVLAQEEGARPQSVERLPGVPEDFTLPPGPDASPANRMEPMVQPLPQPSATPTITASPVLDALPLANPAPQAAASPGPAPEPEPERDAQVASPARPGADVPAAEPELPQAEVESTVPQVERAPVAPPVVTQAAPEGVSHEESSGWAMAVWLLGGLLLAALAALGVWWLRRRSDAEAVVEKIEPYRPTPSPAPAERSPRSESQTPAAEPPSGLVHASRTAPDANPGGFVTSTIATRPQEPRRYTSSDGRIVTSLSRPRD